MRARSLLIAMGAVLLAAALVPIWAMAPSAPAARAVKPPETAALEAAPVAAPAAAPASAARPAPDLAISKSNSPAMFSQGQNDATFTVRVTNVGDRPTSGTVVVADEIPAHLDFVSSTADGWSCSGSATRSCTRSDALAPGASYPPITIKVSVANGLGVGEDPAAHITDTATVSGGGDVDPSNDSATHQVKLDACPYGWSPEAPITFSPPFRPGLYGGVPSGVTNPQQSNGCTLLDRIWAGEPFASHGQFLSLVAGATDGFVKAGLLTSAERQAIESAAGRSDVGKKDDHQVDNSCSNRVAFTFDDGTSSYRPQLLKVFREKQVPATFFDNGVRVEANPGIARFQVHEGYVELNHTYTHVHMDELNADANREEILHNEQVLNAAGAPLTFLGSRPPFGGSDPAVQQLLDSMGYVYFLNRIDGEDWLPDKSAEAIADDIFAQARPGVIMGMHDGAIDATNGPQTVKAVGELIDRYRANGYCFGVVDHTGQVVADRNVSSGDPIPNAVNPVPYHLPLAFGTPDQIPGAWTRVPSPLSVSATHSPATFTRGDVGDKLTLTVSNVSDKPGDGSSVTVNEAIPSGLTATAASGPGWTCTGTTTTSCTRTDALAPHSSYPPITVTVDVAGDAPATTTNAPALVAHGESWTDEASDPITVKPRP
ncbi:hypothetical protein Sm713_75990 [Streptomyces sp. TS71-3]|nr:hypothetical protein Sm713_75990 [Streptomyces sp. TS71-3]